MTTKIVYLFDPVTGEFAGTYAAQPSPAEPGKFIEPDHSTSTAPPALAANEAARFSNGAWAVVPDFRGQTFYDQTTGAAVVIDAVGAVAANLAATKPLANALAEARSLALAKTYADVDAIYAAAVGSRAPEYEQAEQAAVAYRDAGYTGAVSAYVSAYAGVAAITDAQSADLIIARATALRSVVLSMRSTRFTSQAAMRAATTQSELDAAVAVWDAFIASVRTGLGL